MSTTMPALSEAALALFDDLAQDAPNWSGTPLLTLTAQEKGYLLHLKTSGLLTTFSDRGDVFVDFTEAGQNLAAQRGIDLGA